MFMLFKGLTADNLSPGSKWTEGERDMSDVERWKRVVGIVGAQSLSDGSLFRVLEPGGMEVVA